MGTGWMISFFCKRCGASVHQTPRGGLLSKCKGAAHAGYKTQRSRLRRGLFPGQNLRQATVSSPCGPTDAMKAIWAPLLGSEPVVDGGGSPEGPGGLPAPGPAAAGGGPQPSSAIVAIPYLTVLQVARLHGFDSPEALVAWESDQPRRVCADFDWDEEDSVG